MSQDAHPQRRFEQRLSQVLIDDGVVTPAEIDEAVEHQVLMGGDLVTNLWELGIGDIKTLTPYAAHTLKLKPVPPRVVARTPKKVLRIVTSRFAAARRMIPLGVRERVLSVALSAPWDLEAIDDAAFRTGCKIQPYYLAEVPLVQLLDKLYGVKASARFRMPPQKRVRHEPGSEPDEDTIGEDLMDDAAFDALYGGVGMGAEAAAATGAEPAPDAGDDDAGEDTRDLPAAPVIGDDEATADAAVILDEDGEEPAELIELTAEVDEAELDEVTMDADQAAELDATLDAEVDAEADEDWSPIADRTEAQALLGAAETRDELGRVLVRVALAKGPRAVLFTLSGGVWLGWTGYGPGIDPDAVRSLMIPPQPGSCFGTVHQTGGQYIGPMTPNPIHDRLLNALGGAKPHTVGLFPVHFHNRVVFGIYTDGGDGAGIDFDIANILIVAQQVPRALERLIQQRRAA